MLCLVLLLLATYGAQAFPWDCANQRNLTLADFPFAYPFDTLVPQPYGNLSGGCAFWRFSIPPQKYATFVLSAEFDVNAYFSITTGDGFRKEYLSGWPSAIPQITSGSTYFFPADPYCSIYLQSNSSGLLSFRIDLHDVPTMPPAVEFQVDSQFNVVTPLSKIAANEYRFKHQTNGSDLLLSLAVNDPNDVRADSCFVYEGPSCKDGTFVVGLGYLEDNWSSHSVDVAVCCFTANIPDFYLIAVPKPDFLQDDDTWISRLISEQTVNLDYFSSSWGPLRSNFTNQYLTTYCPPRFQQCEEYVQSVQRIESNYSAPFKDLSSFSIYAGYPGWNFNKISDIPLGDTETWLPQEIKGTFKTYAAMRGDVTISVSLDSKTWNFTASNRKGFFMTNQYSIQSQNQSTVSKISTPPNAQFTIDTARSTKNVSNGTVWLNTETDIVSLPANGNVSLHGSFLQFNALPEPSPSTGAVVFFEIKQGPTAGSATSTTAAVIGMAIAKFIWL